MDRISFLQGCLIRYHTHLKAKAQISSLLSINSFILSCLLNLTFLSLYLSLFLYLSHTHAHAHANTHPDFARTCRPQQQPRLVVRPAWRSATWWIPRLALRGSSGARCPARGKGHRRPWKGTSENAVGKNAVSSVWWNDSKWINLLDRRIVFFKIYTCGLEPKSINTVQNYA